LHPAERARLTALARKAFDGSLSAAEQAELETLLHDPAAADLYAEVVALDAQLPPAVRAVTPADTDETSPLPADATPLTTSRPPRIRWLPVTLAASVLAVAGAIAVTWPQGEQQVSTATATTPPTTPVQAKPFRVSGAAEVVRADGTRVPAGDWADLLADVTVRTADEEAMIDGPGGRVECGPGTVVTLVGGELFVRQGAVRASGGVGVRTPHGVVSGRAFSAAVGDDRTEVDTDGDPARVQPNGTAAVDVTPGRAVVVRATGSAESVAVLSGPLAEWPKLAAIEVGWASGRLWAGHSTGLSTFDPADGFKPLTESKRPRLSFASGFLVREKGSVVATAGKNTPMTVLDADTAEPLRELPMPPGFTIRLKFSPDGAYLLARRGETEEKIARAVVWDTATWTERTPFTGVREVVQVAGWVPNTTLLAGATTKGPVLLWDVAAEKLVGTIPGKDRFGVLTGSPDGTHLAAAGEGTDRLVVWDISDPAKPREVCSPPGSGRRFNGLAFSPDGELLAAGGRQKVVKVWRVGDGKELLHIPAGTGEDVPLAFSPDGRFLAVGRKPVQVWQLPADLGR
jgi:hypothetical protein